MPTARIVPIFRVGGLYRLRGSEVRYVGEPRRDFHHFRLASGEILPLSHRECLETIDAGGLYPVPDTYRRSSSTH